MSAFSNRRMLKILRRVVTPIRGSPISALGSLVSIFSKSTIPSDSTLKEPAQEIGLSSST